MRGEGVFGGEVAGEVGGEGGEVLGVDFGDCGGEVRGVFGVRLVFEIFPRNV